jgi:citrate synthase
MEVVPGLEGIPAAESAISFIDGEKGILEYRGIPVGELAEKSTFLEVAYLLIFGKFPTTKEFEKFREHITFHTRLKLKILRMMEYLPEGGHPMDYLQAVTSAMGMYYPARNTLDEHMRYQSVVRLISKLPTIVAACHRLRHGDAPIQPDNSLSSPCRPYNERLHLQRPCSWLHARRSLYGCLLCHRDAIRPSTRRSERGRRTHA